MHTHTISHNTHTLTLSHTQRETHTHAHIHTQSKRERDSNRALFFDAFEVNVGIPKGVRAFTFAILDLYSVRLWIDSMD